MAFYPEIVPRMPETPRGPFYPTGKNNTPLALPTVATGSSLPHSYCTWGSFPSAHPSPNSSKQLSPHTQGFRKQGQWPYLAQDNRASQVTELAVEPDWVTSWPGLYFLVGTIHCVDPGHAKRTGGSHAHIQTLVHTHRCTHISTCTW